MKCVNEILFRASANGLLMTDPQSKKAKDAGELSKTTQSLCIDVFCAWHYDRQEDAYSKYMEKGIEVEEEALTLLSLNDKKMRVKNAVNFKDEHFSGTPDVVSDIIEDVKSSWDIFTFTRAKHAGISKMHYWQLQTYMALTGKQKAAVHFCLVNATESLIHGEKTKLIYVIKDPELLELKQREVEKNMIYDIEKFRVDNPEYQLLNEDWKWDIPKKDRIFTIEVDRDDAGIEDMRMRVDRCRVWIKDNLL